MGSKRSISATPHLQFFIAGQQPPFRGALSALVGAATPVAMALALGGLPRGAQAVSFTYDANTGTTGAQDGSGLGWDTTTQDWWIPGGDYAWGNSTVLTAVFGAGSGAAGPVTVAAGGVTAGGITFNAPGSGNYTLQGGTITIGGISDISAAAGLTPSIATTINASGTVTFGVSSSYTGTVSLSGSGSSVGPVDVEYGTLQVTGGSISTATFATNSAGGNGNYSQTGGTVSAGGAGVSLSENGGASNFVVSGGTFNCDGGDFVINTLGNGTADIVQVQGSGVITGVNRFSFGYASGYTPSNYATLYLGDGTTFTSGTSIATGTSGMIVANQVGKDLLGSAGTNTAQLFIDGGTLKAAENNSTFMQGLDLADVEPAGGIIDNGGYAITIAQSLVHLSGPTDGGLVFQGSGTTTLSGNNTFTGNVVVNSGILQLGNTNALGASNIAVTKVVVASGATLDLNGYGSYNGITIAGTGMANQGALINSGTSTSSASGQTPFITLSANASIGGTGDFYEIALAPSANTLNLAGFALQKVGSNTFWLDSTTVTAGTVQISGGSISQTTNASNASATAFTLDNTAGVTLALNNLPFSVGSLAGGGSTGGNVTTGGTSGILSVGGLGTSTTYAGIISGHGSLTMNGSGTLALTGPNTYTGGTIINAGTLLAMNSTTATGSSSTGSSGITLNGGRLGGTGIINSGSTINIYGGVISPGPDAANTISGTLTTGYQAWFNGGTYLMKTSLPTGNGISGTAFTESSVAGSTTQDFLMIEGALAIQSSAGGFTINVSNSAPLAGTATFIIANAIGGISGSNLTDEFIVKANGGTQPSYYSVASVRDTAGGQDLEVTIASYVANVQYMASVPGGTTAGTQSVNWVSGSQTVGVGINTSDGKQHGLIWNGTGVATDINPSAILGSSSSSVVWGTNGTQQVGYGSGSATSNQHHALLWTGTAASAVDLNPTLLGSNSTSEAFGTNGTQQFGYGYGSSTGGASYPHALLWTGTAASAVDLNPSLLGSGSYSYAYGTNGTQQVGFGAGSATGSGWVALLWTGTAASAVDLNPSSLLGANPQSVAQGLGGTQQVGYGRGSVTGLNYHALLWTGTAASAVDLNPSLLGSNSQSFAVGTNGTQQVGYGEGSATGGYLHALLWYGSAASAVDLNAMLTSAQLPGTTGAISSAPFSVDSSGDVFGDAWATDAITSSQTDYFAVEWSTPEPGSLSLLGIGSLGLLGRRRRRAR